MVLFRRLTGSNDPYLSREPGFLIVSVYRRLSSAICSSFCYFKTIVCLLLSCGGYPFGEKVEGCLLSVVRIFAVGVSLLHFFLKLYFFMDLSFMDLEIVLACFNPASAKSSFSSERSETLE